MDGIVSDEREKLRLLSLLSQKLLESDPSLSDYVLNTYSSTLAWMDAQDIDSPLWRSYRERVAKLGRVRALADAGTFTQLSMASRHEESRLERL